MREIKFLDMPDQEFSAVLNARRVTFRIRYNPSNDRYSFDMALDDEFVVFARKIVTGVDLLAVYGYGLGKLFAVPYFPGAVANRENIATGQVRLYHE